MSEAQGWRFWIDRGGTFTDVAAVDPDGALITTKLLSEDPERYEDAAIEGIRRLRKEHADGSYANAPILEVRMGTTVGTNALLEHNGAPVALLITAGFEDALRIGYQNRPDIFALDIEAGRPRMLYERLIGVHERLAADGKILQTLDESKLRAELTEARKAGLRSAAVVLMHAYCNPIHELRAGEIARDVGFEDVSLSHEVSPLIKLVRRGDTTVVDAHLSPVLRRYTERVRHGLANLSDAAPRLFFMQSHGGLTVAENFRGRDSLLSGPAGGVVGGVAVSEAEGYRKIIGFDMGGTSTDVWHYAGELERSFESEIAGARLQSPVLAIHTVAAGGGSVLEFDGERLRVGPRSSGSRPGPRSYGHGGPLSLTDANLILGRVQPAFFPHVFGSAGTAPLDHAGVSAAFEDLARSVGAATDRKLSPEQLAAGFVDIAVEHMARAIRKISVQRGYDPGEYVLCSFGGAGGQHACAIAAALNMTEILLHPLAGVLSAYGMGTAKLRRLDECYSGADLDDLDLAAMDDELGRLQTSAGQELARHLDGEAPEHQISAHLKYAGSDTTIEVPWPSSETERRREALRRQFEEQHRRGFGFVREAAAIVLDRLVVETSGGGANPITAKSQQTTAKPEAAAVVQLWCRGDSEGAGMRDAPLYRRADLGAGHEIAGPALIVSETDTVFVDTGWTTSVTASGALRLFNANPILQTSSGITSDEPSRNVDPVRLEIMNHAFRAIAEEMGVVLQKTSVSVNIKERLDFSCALFDSEGRLVANAPHIPVHLGSMSASVDAVRERFGADMQPGDAFVLNDPYAGGTHLPDITVVTPVFLGEANAEARLLFYTASRGHHADIGGIAPGSMPARSRSIVEEGVLIEPRYLCRGGRILEDEIRTLLIGAKHPVRNLKQNLADLAAQVAANERGSALLAELCRRYDADTVLFYMQAVQDNAERAVRRALANVRRGSAERVLDNDLHVRVDVRDYAPTDGAPERFGATPLITADFTGSSPAHAGNFNAPLAVLHAALIYVVRTLVEDEIPLNAGCLRPVHIIVPVDSFLHPRAPRAVVAGNVETSQMIVDTIYAALGILAGSQGTMNNLTFGNANFQYYETICGGAGAGPGFAGASAVHTHMTNSRLTDPEVLEERFPVRVEEFSLRRGSGGSGQFRGGDGVLRRLRFLEDVSVSLLTNHRKIAPGGIRGGGDGQPGRNRLLRGDGTETTLDSCDQVELRSGDAIIVETPGGGGCGDA